MERQEDCYKGFDYYTHNYALFIIGNEVSMIFRNE